MPTQFDIYGFEDLRNYMQHNWNFVAVMDSNGDEVLRRNVDADAGAEWSSGSSTNPLTASLTVTGQDIQDLGLTLPVTLSSTETYKSDTATSRTTHDTFSDVTINALDDEVEIIHEYRAPP